MELVRGLHNLRPQHRGCVLSIGNYDGVHRGHQALLAELFRLAGEYRVPAAVMVFEPSPREYFDPAGAPPRLTGLREKLEDLRAAGVRRVVLAKFDARLAAMEAEAFVDELIITRLGAKAVVVGDDFRFGAHRRGDYNLLAAKGAALGVETLRLPSILCEGQRISSTRIREWLAAGEVGLVNDSLGRAYRISGRVAYGRQLGRTLGTPTANIVLRRKPAPRLGVYAVRARLAGGRELPGVANLGLRPTVGGEACWLETHLFDFSGNLYGQHMEVAFLGFLRDEQRFATIDELRLQIQRDAAQARVFLNH